MSEQNVKSSWLYSSAKTCAWLFTAVSLFWLCIAGYFWVDSAKHQLSWEKATATVTKVAEEEGDESRIKYSFLTFADSKSGQDVTVRSQMGASNMPIYPLGSEVEVIYPAGEPQKAIENNISQYILPLALTLVVIITGVVALASFFVSRKLKK